MLIILCIIFKRLSPGRNERGEGEERRRNPSASVLTLFVLTRHLTSIATVYAGLIK